MPIQVDAALHSNNLLVRILPSRGSVSYRTPYHIALLLDTSGSMEGEPISGVLRTLHLLIDRMDEQDFLTIIQYSSDASVLVNCRKMNSLAKSELHSLVNTLEADGGTNMEAAIEEISNVDVSSGPIDSVFLMTDGFINSGITSSAGLLRLLSARLAAGTPVNTLGYGNLHNSEMLRDMAVRSRGSYTFADSIELIPAIIGDIVGGLDERVGSNAVVSARGGRCIELGIDILHPSVYNVGQLIVDKPQWVVFQGSSLPVKVTWTEGGVEKSLEVTSLTTMDAMEMEEQIQRVRLVETMNTVANLIRDREHDRAIEALIAHAHTLTLSPAAGRPFITRLQAQVDEMVEDVRSYDSRALTRMISNTTALGTQHGFFLSRNTTVSDPDVIRSPFSTPHQRDTTMIITQRFQEYN